MNKRQIILAQTIILAGWQPLSAQQFAPTAPPMGPAYPTTAPAVAGPPYLQAPPMIQAAPQGVPIYPPQTTVVPLPSQAGPAFGTPFGQPGGVPVEELPPGGVAMPQAGTAVGPPVVA